MFVWWRQRACCCAAGLLADGHSARRAGGSVSALRLKSPLSCNAIPLEAALVGATRASSLNLLSYDSQFARSNCVDCNRRSVSHLISRTVAVGNPKKLLGNLLGRISVLLQQHSTIIANVCTKIFSHQLESNNNDGTWKVANY